MPLFYLWYKFGYFTVPLVGEEPPSCQEGKEGGVKGQESQSPPSSWQLAAGVQPAAEEECVVGNSHLARQALPHGEEVGLLSGGQAHSEVLQGLLQGHEQPLPPAGEEDSRHKPID